MTYEEDFADRIARLRARLPIDDFAPEELDELVTENRAELLELFINAQKKHETAAAEMDASGDFERPADEASPAKRTAANIAAMQLAAQKRPEEMTDADRRVLMGYSGWGGLSLEKVADKLPADMTPEARGLIHEFYTPTAVTDEVARVLRPYLETLPRLPGSEGLLALEPSAGIGRFIYSLDQVAKAAGVRLDWLAVEYSEVSGRLLQALRTGMSVAIQSFEAWVAEHESDYRGRISLVASNPPYGIRGLSRTHDPVRAYREKRAYAYFLRRGLDLLAGGGIGAYLIPAGFMSGLGAAARTLREIVLKRHHVMGAYRLPSSLFPGAMLVTDIVFFRARGGALAAVDASDDFILEGRYFDTFPTHILGTVKGDIAAAETPEGKRGAKARWGYQIEGKFTKLPDLVERPLCQSCVTQRDVAADGTPARTRRSGVARRISETPNAELSEPLQRAVQLGLRFDAYLAAIQQAQRSDTDPTPYWRELHDGLTAWAAVHGNPWASAELAALTRTENVGAQRFLQAFEKTGGLIPQMLQPPAVPLRYRGRPNDVVGQADQLYRERGEVTAPALQAAHRAARGSLPWADIERALMASGAWCRDDAAPADDPEGPWRFLPKRDYLTGALWPRYDRAKVRAAAGDAIAERQAGWLLDSIRPVLYEDLELVSPRQGWVPLDLVAEWIDVRLNRGDGRLRLVRDKGVVTVADVAYSTLSDGDDVYGVGPEALWAIGWLNHDRTLFDPGKSGYDSTDEKRLALAAEWDKSFVGWLAESEDRRDRIVAAYNRQMRGFVAPDYSAEPLNLVRWDSSRVQLKSHQAGGARRIIAQRRGLLAFDVGVGKTYTGLAVLAHARQEGWAQRPVILVPNSIAWKWKRDIERVLPDYTALVIGSKRKTVMRGPKGQRRPFVTSDVDTPQERAQKWTEFQAGGADVVILTYSALGRTRVNEDRLREYVTGKEAIQREVLLRQRNLQKEAERRELTEREQAILTEGTAAWLAEKLELPETWEYDPGIAWDDIGIDLLIIDEAQNFKNLYGPAVREGGQIPRYMGAGGEGSDRAWQLDFRCAAVRRRTGGSGVVLLSATPAKNSPLEFYNLIQLVDDQVWPRRGVYDPENFIDRFLKLEMMLVPTPTLEFKNRLAVTGFLNLHELRDVVFRIGEFRTAEEVGIKTPEPTVHLVEVDMTPEQDRAYVRLIATIEDAIKNPLAPKGIVLGCLARMALVALHPQLDRTLDGAQEAAGDQAKKKPWTYKSAGEVRFDKGAPKLVACAERIMKTPTCGHIVFCDNVAIHRWLHDVLVERGMPAERIAILNGEVAKASADRQRIAQEFNGDAEAGLEPKYDVVIANAIAYEGVDLQTRTCAIHHLDLPWEPATLQQRNGRGVRQGNVNSNIEINYYFARRSSDGIRYDMIAKKRGWMVALLESQDRETNNPGAQSDLGAEDVMLLISRDPARTKALIDEARGRQEADARKKTVESAARSTRSAGAQFAEARRNADSNPTLAVRLRAEGEARLKDVARYSPDVWPWADLAMRAREEEIAVSNQGGPPIFQGLRAAVGFAETDDDDGRSRIEVGRIADGAYGLLEQNGVRWLSLRVSELPKANEGRTWLSVRREHLLSAEQWTQTQRPIDQELERALQTLRYRGWQYFGWGLASDAWVSDLWPRWRDRIILGALTTSFNDAKEQALPVLERGGVLALIPPGTFKTAGFSDASAVLPPTAAGWTRFLELAPASPATWTELAQTALWWWTRRLPRSAKVEQESAAPAPALAA